MLLVVVVRDEAVGSIALAVRVVVENRTADERVEEEGAGEHLKT